MSRQGGGPGGQWGPWTAWINHSNFDFQVTPQSKHNATHDGEMLEEPDISSLLDALNSNRLLLARTRICLARLQRNPRRYHGRIEVNAPRKIAYMINLTPGLARLVLEDPRFQDGPGVDVGVMKKSERLLRVSVPITNLIPDLPCRGMSVSETVFLCNVLMLLV